MATGPTACVPDDGPRHTAAWYSAVGDEFMVKPGDRLLIPCDGGPSISRLEIFPPPLEIEERGGMYVLEDEGAPAQWRYRFVTGTI
jgi:hypothetical protein